MYPYTDKELKHEIKNTIKQRNERSLKCDEKTKAVIENKPPKIPIKQASPFVSSMRIPGMTHDQLESYLVSLGASPSSIRDDS